MNTSCRFFSLFVLALTLATSAFAKDATPIYNQNGTITIGDRTLLQDACGRPGYPGHDVKVSAFDSPLIGATFNMTVSGSGKTYQGTFESQPINGVLKRPSLLGKLKKVHGLENGFTFNVKLADGHSFQYRYAKPGWGACAIEHLSLGAKGDGAPPLAPGEAPNLNVGGGGFYLSPIGTK